MRLSGRSTARRLTPGTPVQNPSHPGRVLLRFEENPGLDVGAPPSVRKGSQTRALSHPGRVLLRFEKNPGLDVGAPPSVRKGVEPEHLRTRGGCSYRSRGTPGFDVGEPRFRCRSTALGAKRVSNQSTFAPGAGAPTVRGEFRF